MTLYLGETTVNEGHRHAMVVDVDGDGITSEGKHDGHTHDVVGLAVQPAMTDGHTHGVLSAFDEIEVG